MATAEQIASRAAVAIENARLYGERSRIAHTLQQSLVPEQLPEILGFELASAYLPAVADTEAGGDFYDVWKVGGAWMLTIGDVTGKGVEAAALTAVVRHTMRATSEFVASPSELLARLDRTLKKNGALSVCTVLCLHDAGDRVTIAAGGHPLPLCLSAEGVHSLGDHGPLLGALDNVTWTESTVRLAPGSTLLLYTDGITDAVGEGGARYGTERLVSTLVGLRDGSAAAIVDGLINALSAFQVGSSADDVAVLALGSSTPVVGAATSNPGRANATISTGGAAGWSGRTSSRWWSRRRIVGTAVAVTGELDMRTTEMLRARHRSPRDRVTRSQRRCPEIATLARMPTAPAGR